MKVRGSYGHPPLFVPAVFAEVLAAWRRQSRPARALLAAWGTDPGRPPDFDADGNVGILDLLTLIANWGPCPDCPADLDGDGQVGAFDLALLLGAWGPCE